MIDTVTEYKRLRVKGWQSLAAIEAARVRAHWDRVGGQIVATDPEGKPYDSIWDEGEPDSRVRLLIVTDYDGWESAMDFDCEGDCGYPKSDELCREHEATAERIDRDGVYGIVSEWRHSTGEWKRSEWDSCWGFVGDDWKESGYDIDAMRSALDSLATKDGC